MNSIFQRKNPAIEKLFVEAGSPKKVMCIPIDYAKKQHTALVCNGEGLQLRGVFNIHNTTEGVDFLEDIIKGLCKKHSIRKTHVFFGGEDCTAFCYNFIYALLEKNTSASASTPTKEPRPARINSPAPTNSTSSALPPC